MNALYERTMLEAIESHELFGKDDMARKLIKEYRDGKNKSQKKESKMIKKIKFLKGH